MVHSSIKLWGHLKIDVRDWGHSKRGKALASDQRWFKNHWFSTPKEHIYSPNKEIELIRVGMKYIYIYICL